ncbi:hypothetical protein Pmani_022682 [Petrolisthes manimaculis]|uniref:Uncharacterized protein n=1 Tax=Petrolisthes manimaculis TaxID=1843537 RepID=A0AAE1PBB0_9EUCA|nr:hypothetical protein Pmani_022682 [Petrolisthes manimaculis]
MFCVVRGGWVSVSCEGKEGVPTNLTTSAHPGSIIQQSECDKDSSVFVIVISPCLETPQETWNDAILYNRG